MHSVTTYVLLGTAISTALFHTLIPDHWLPFVLIGKPRGWSVSRTAVVSGASALLHTALSVLLALLALGLGEESAHALGRRLEDAGGLLLIAFGLSYGVWAWRKGGHFHPGGQRLHPRGETETCEGTEGDAGADHLHYHADTELIHGTSGKGDWYLALIVGLNPCILFMPVLLAARGSAAVASVTLAYTVTTVVLMVGLSVAGVAGARRVRIPRGARHMEAASGFLIAAVGIVFWWFLD